ncbi:MAG: ankyrin repeat domain-containing protein [Nitrospirota bacterium]|nr:ankyrin repeat domain-containing protein [Nitrospirota bacterium]
MLIAFLLPGCGLGLMHAADSGDTSAVSSLLDQAIDPNTQFPILGSSSLILAASKGHTEMVGLLLDRGAHINATDRTGWTPLHAAIYGGHAEVVRLLLERGAQLDQPDHWYLASPLALAESLARDSDDRRKILTVIEAY